MLCILVVLRCTRFYCLLSLLATTDGSHHLSKIVIRDYIFLVYKKLISLNLLDLKRVFEVFLSNYLLIGKNTLAERNFPGSVKFREHNFSWMSKI